MQRYNKNKDGLPLIPYSPAPIDRIPVPNPPIYELYTEFYPVCVWEQACTGRTDEREGFAVENLQSLFELVNKTIKDWNETAMATGKFENAYLIWDPGCGQFFAVYERLATIPEIINIRAAAQEELKWRESVFSEMDKKYKAAKDILGEE